MVNMIFLACDQTKKVKVLHASFACEKAKLRWWMLSTCSVLAGQTSVMNIALLQPTSKLYVDGEYCRG